MKESMQFTEEFEQLINQNPFFSFYHISESQAFDQHIWWQGISFTIQRSNERITAYIY